MPSTDTTLDVAKEILRATGQSVNVTEFADTNDTAYILDRINEALDNIYDLKPSGIDVDATLTLTTSTRKLSLPSTLDPYRIYSWSWKVNDSDGDIDLDFVTKEFITESFPLYETEEAEQPQYVYLDGVYAAFYPLLKAGSSSLTIQYTYPAQFAKLTSKTDVFPFPNRSPEMAYIKYSAQRDYELFKGFGQPGVTDEKARDKWAILVAKYQKGKRIGFKGYRRYTRRGR